MQQEIRELFSYTRWANERMRAAASRLSAEELGRNLGSSFPSVLATLAHILFGEWIWLERWQGRSPMALPADWDLSTWEELTQRWEEVAERQAAFVAALAPGDLHRVVHYTNTTGAPFDAPLWQLMLHLVNHSTYHRGQVATLLRQLGTQAPSTDLVVFHRERSPVAAATAATAATTLPVK